MSDDNGVINSDRYRSGRLFPVRGDGPIGLLSAVAYAELTEEN